MKQVLSLFTFGIGALLFVAFFSTLKPTVVTAASESGTPGQCSTKGPLTRSLIFATALWSDVERQN
jgi:hypothetical protein